MATQYMEPSRDASVQYSNNDLKEYTNQFVMSFDDPNDPRHFPMRNPLMPPYGYSTKSRHKADEDSGKLMYHDFDYVGYERKQTPEESVHNRTGNLSRKGQEVKASGRNINNDSSDTLKFKSFGSRPSRFD
jgi:hypothetical protein